MSEFDVPVETALAMLDVDENDDGPSVHCFLNPSGGMMLGADWSFEEVKELFAKYPPQEAGPRATAMGHGIVCKRPEGPAFFATKEKSSGTPTA